jgi:flagellar biosynthesis/type III secretory pathway protein FliH
MAVHLSLEGEKLIQEVAIYIDGILQQEVDPPTAEKVLSVVSSKLKELEDDAEIERQRNSARTMDSVSQPVAGSSKEATEPQQEGGAAKEDANAPPLELRGSSRLHGGLQAAMDAYRRRLGIVVAIANHVNLDELEPCLEASEKLTATFVDLQAQCAGKATAEGKGDAWRQGFAEWTADVEPAKEQLTAAIKLLQAKQRKNMYQAASRAVDRALAAANDA